MLQNIVYVILVASNLILLWYKLPAKLFWSVYGFSGFGTCIIILQILGLQLIALAVGVLWIHGILRYRHHLQPAVRELYEGTLNKKNILAKAETYIRPKIDPENIQGGFYGLKGYTANPYER
jgi:hypothetical protein